MNYNTSKYISYVFIHLIFLLDHPTKVFEDNHETTRDKRTIQVRLILFNKFNKFTFCFSPQFLVVILVSLILFFKFFIS